MKLLGGVILGSALTAAILLLLRPPSGPTRATGPVGGATGAGAARAPGSPAPATRCDDAWRAEVLRKRIIQLENELREARVARVAEPTPSAAGSTAGPMAFPPDVPEAYRPEKFQAIALRVARECGTGLDVVAVDCSEFPCIAWLRVTDPQGHLGRQDAVDPRTQSFSTTDCAPWNDAFKDSSLGVLGDEARGRYVSLMPSPPDRKAVMAAMQRAMERESQMAEALGVPLFGGGGGEQAAAASPRAP